MGKVQAVLPAEGRLDPAPEWPLEQLPTKTELGVWATLWALPQATQWEKQGSNRVVARYVRQLLMVEGPDPSTRLAAEVRQLEDRLGLNPMAMARFGWVIDEVLTTEKEEIPDVPNLSDYRTGTD